MRLILGASLLLFSIAASAETVTLDFEGVVPDEGILTLNPDYQENGFIFDAGDSLAGVVGKDYSWNPLQSAALYWCGIDDPGFASCSGDDVTLSHEASTFNLQSFVVTFTQYQSPAEIRIDLEGLTQSGSVLQESIAFAAGQTIILDSSWSNLESVNFSAHVTGGDQFTSFSPVIDDIVVSVVPIPAAVWLFGSALAGLGWIRRKRVS